MAVMRNPSPAEGWPESVPVPENIGTQVYHNPRTGEPCCALGHVLHIQQAPNNRTNFIRSFRSAYACLHDEELSVEATNDLLPPDQRLLYYCAAWAKLGYTDGCPPEALALLEKTHAD